MQPAKLKLTHVTAVSWPHVIGQYTPSTNAAEDTKYFDDILKNWQAYQEKATENENKIALKRTLQERGLQVVEGAKGVTLKTEVKRLYEFKEPLVRPGANRRRAKLDPQEILNGLQGFERLLRLEIPASGEDEEEEAKTLSRGKAGVHAFVIDKQWLGVGDDRRVHDLLVGSTRWTKTRTYALLKSLDGHSWSVKDFIDVCYVGMPSYEADQLAYWQHTWNVLSRGDYKPFREGDDYETKWFARLRRQFPDLSSVRSIGDAKTKAELEQARALAHRAAKMKDLLNDLDSEKDHKQQISLLLQFVGFPETKGDADSVQEALAVAFEEIEENDRAAFVALREVGIFVALLDAGLKKKSLPWARACEFFGPTISDVIALSTVYLLRYYSKWKGRIFFYHMEHYEEEPINLSAELLQCAYMYDAKSQTYAEPTEWPVLQSYYTGPLAILAAQGDGWLGDALYTIHPEVRQSAFVTAMGPFLANRMKLTPVFVKSRGDPAEERRPKRLKVIGQAGTRYPPLVNPGAADSFQRLDLDVFNRTSEQIDKIGPNIGKFTGKARAAVKMFR